MDVCGSMLDQTSDHFSGAAFRTPCKVLAISVEGLVVPVHAMKHTEGDDVSSTAS
jgi:hypothetical protein